MSDNAIGVIGQMYEDRKTGKRGVLESRDDKYKTLMLVDNDGKSFSITNATFRSKWRKIKDTVEDSTETADTINSEVMETINVVENEESEVVNLTTEPDMSLDSYMKFINTTRDCICSVDNITKEIKICIDNIVVLVIKPLENSAFKLSMMQDVFYETDWSDIGVNNIKMSLSTKDNLVETFDTDTLISLSTIFQATKDAVRDINLDMYKGE